MSQRPASCPRSLHRNARAARVRLVSMAAGIGVLTAVRNRYRRGLRRDHERLRAFKPEMLETPFGQVEYAQAGEGSAVLVVHGVFGGDDFGVGAGRVNVPPSYRIISPPRFGYIGSPFRADPSPAAQADAFAALLDHLGVAPLPVVAFSAGSSSALQLALRYPERVSRLVLISPNSPHPKPLPKTRRLLAPILFSQLCSGRCACLRARVWRACRGHRTVSCPTSLSTQRCGRSSIACSRSALARGTMYDSYIGNLDVGRYPFASIRVPVLVIAAEDDTLAPYEDSRAMGEQIPGARFVSVPRGGHALTQLDPGARRPVAEFLSPATEDAPAESSAPAQGAAT